MLPKISAIFLVGLIFSLPFAALAEEISVSEIITLTNQKREEQGLSALEPSLKLSKAASSKAEDILQNDYFAHTTPDGKNFYEWIEEAGYYYMFAGENLAIDFETSKGATEAWMASATHRANILNKNYKEIGVAAIKGNWNGKETFVIVQMFGSSLESSPTVLGWAVENFNINFEAQKQLLKSLATNFIMIPSLAGGTYFDIFLKPNQREEENPQYKTMTETKYSMNTKIVQGKIYQTLMQKKEKCCNNGISLSFIGEEKKTLIKTPVSYPILSKITPNLKTGIGVANLPKSLYNNLLIAGISCLLLLMAYKNEIKKLLAAEKIKIRE